jgi:hypothetical protein
MEAVPGKKGTNAWLKAIGGALIRPFMLGASGFLKTSQKAKPCSSMLNDIGFFKFRGKRRRALMLSHITKQ